jgi:hypothetical protein
MEILKPRGSLPIRKPTDNNMQNGQIFNPPRFSQMGGGKDGTGINSQMYKNKMGLEKPGGTKKVI